jgi:DNA-binding GntR family transcriptional regulator
MMSSLAPLDARNSTMAVVAAFRGDLPTTRIASDGHLGTAQPPSDHDHTQSVNHYLLPWGRPARSSVRDRSFGAIAVTVTDFPSDESVYQRLRAEILAGTLERGTRLVTADLARRFGSSTNPVREALQQLRGEGLVEISHNRGARVRDLGITFVRDVIEIEELLEPYLVRVFVRIARPEDIDALERIQGEIEALNFRDRQRHNDLDTRFHRLFYDAHYNGLAADLWFRHREMLGLVGRAFDASPKRQAEVIEEHRLLIAAVRRFDEDEAARIVARHVRGSGEHLIEHLQRRERLANI